MILGEVRPASSAIHWALRTRGTNERAAKNFVHLFLNWRHRTHTALRALWKHFLFFYRYVKIPLFETALVPLLRPFNKI